MEDNNNPANRGCCDFTTRRPARSLPPKMNNYNQRYLSSSSSTQQQQVKHLASSSLFGLVIILSCLSPSIIASSLTDSAAAATAAAAAVNSAFDFTINNPIGESGGGSLRSLPYLSSSAAAASGSSFDPSSYKNIYEAIRSHPDLREVSLPETFIPNFAGRHCCVGLQLTMTICGHYCPSLDTNRPTMKLLLLLLLFGGALCNFHSRTSRPPLM